MNTMSRSVPIILLAGAVLACESVEPYPEVEYAAVPAVAMSPDSFAVRLGDWVFNERGLSRPSPHEGTPGVHVTYTQKEDDPWIVRCDREPDGFPDCAEFERSGFVIIGRTAFDAVRANLSECSTGDANAVGGRLTLKVSSCLGLTRYQHFWDTTKVEFVPAPWRDGGGSTPHVIGCGTSWYGYRLLRRGGVTHALDAMFSDTVWITTTDC
ncbi:MAG: hypothetical protein F4Z32_04930 [Gemmatimonadetes bacterium]|nr:hypothetical protein [Gemmatimonadota bacterium]